jgi:hypothetical protein
VGAALGSDTLHPAAEWALTAGFGPVEVDCTTTVVLKILDNKCKMLPGEKAAVLAVYDVVKGLPAELFGEPEHETIRRARGEPGARTSDAIHQLRVKAEELIPKPVMKNYKALLRHGLFG